jgi:hypothetical protein
LTQGKQALLFEKRSKNFYAAVADQPAANGKSVLVLFFKKEPLAFWAGTEATPIPQKSGSGPVGMTCLLSRSTRTPSSRAHFR